MIKLLALDLDGTLLNSQGQIPEANKRAIKEAEEAGVLVTFATGRRFRDARPVALEVGFNAPIVTHNGALLKNAETLETFHASLLSKDTTIEVLRAGKEFGADALVSCDPHGKGTLLYDNLHEDNIPLKKYVAWSQRVHGDEGHEAVHHVEDLAAEVPGIEVVHISFSGHCAAMARMNEFLRGELGDSVNILATIYTEMDFTLLDVLPPDATKGTGLHRLALEHGIAPEEVMAMGDNHNDLEMLEYAGTAVVMGNAQQELLARDDFHKTTSNDLNGVAEAIKRFILSQK